MRTHVERLYLFILLFGPLAFGTTESWSKAILAGAVFLCASLFFYDRRKHRRPLLKVPGLLPLAIWLGLIAGQLLPLPAGLVKLISPATHTLYQETVGLTQSVPWMRLTVDLKATIFHLILFCAYLMFYVLSVQLLSRADFLKRAVRVVITFGALMALLAIVQAFSAEGRIFWFRETVGGNAFGPFVNRNHYAGWMVMLCPVALGMMLFNKPRVVYETWRERISEFFNTATTNVYLLLLLAVMLMAVSVFVSLSRGGIVCLSLALMLQGIIMFLKAEGGRGRGMMVATIAAAILLVVGWFGWDPIFARFNQIRDPQGDIAETRLAAWQDSLAIIRDYPVAGTGAGTFFHAHKAYRKATPGGKFFVHAHNDYIETAADDGIIGLVCFGAFVVVVLASIKTYRRRHDPYCIYLFSGAVTGLAAFLLHCIVEFNLQIGANALYFFFLAGLCVAASHTRLHTGHRRSLLPHVQNTWMAPVLATAAPLLLVVGTLLNLGAYLGELHFNNAMDDYTQTALTADDYAGIENRARKATIYDPFESQNHIILADAEAALDQTDAALASCRRAIRINPMNGIYLQTQAAFYAQTGQAERVEQFHHAALKYEGANPQIHANYGLWLIGRQELKKGTAALQRAITLAPGLTKAIVGQLALLELTYDQLVAALPRKVEPYLALGDYLVEVEQKDLALAAYAGALEYLPMENGFQAAWFDRLQRFYLSQGMLDEALRAVSMGANYLPENSELRYTLGTLYEKMGILYRAEEEYMLAIGLNPKNTLARKRLEYLQ